MLQFHFKPKNQQKYVEKKPKKQYNSIKYNCIHKAIKKANLNGN